MSTKIPAGWVRFLILTIFSFTLFGLAFVILPNFTQQFFNWVLFGTTVSPFTAEVDEFLKFVYGVLGAVIVGWTITLLYIANGAFRRGDMSAWQAIAVSFGVWYAIDSTISIVTGNGGNAILNTLLIILLAIPLGATYRHFREL